MYNRRKSWTWQLKFKCNINKLEGNDPLFLPVAIVTWYATERVLDSHNHEHYTYTYTFRNIFNTIRTSEDTSLEKYTSHFIERVVFERELETEENSNILTPTLMAITAFLSRSPGLLNWGPGVPASLGHGPHSSIFCPTDLNSNCSIGCPEGPLYWVRVFSTTSYLQLIRTSCRRGYIIIWLPLFFLQASQFRTQFNPIDNQGYILIFLDWMLLLFTQMHFLFWQLGRVGGQYTTREREVNSPTLRCLNQQTPRTNC